eukprot:15439556-Alexandrium_andersonii.AAC.1
MRRSCWASARAPSSSAGWSCASWPGAQFHPRRVVSLTRRGGKTPAFRSACSVLKLFLVWRTAAIGNRCLKYELLRSRRSAAA